MPLDLNRPFIPVAMAVITVSDSRNAQTDISGNILSEKIVAAGHPMPVRHWVKDEQQEITKLVKDLCQAKKIAVIILTGGTGITGRDVTPEALTNYAQLNSGKEIIGFGELFRMLSYEKIGSSTIQSRAIGYVIHGVYIFALPGSTAAVKDAWDGILSSQLDNRHRPCNFVELMPRLRE